MKFEILFFSLFIHYLWAASVVKSSVSSSPSSSSGLASGYEHDVHCLSVIASGLLSTPVTLFMDADNVSRLCTANFSV